MASRSILEVVSAQQDHDVLVYASEQPFTAFTVGDSFSFVGHGGAVITRKINRVQHTIWVDGAAPVQKVSLLLK